MLKFTSIVGYTSCGPTYIESFLTIFGQCINVLNCIYIYIYIYIYILYTICIYILVVFTDISRLFVPSLFFNN